MADPQRRLLSGWGLTAPTAAEVVAVDSPAVVVAALDGPHERGVLGRGLGRSYGDAAQNAGGAVLDMAALGSPITIDTERATARVGAGVSIDLLLRRVVPLGFFVPVTPGTRFVTIGGAIAADIHGKNHHKDGSISRHVTSMTLATPTGTRPVGPDDEVFWATTGGMGLTGVLLDAELALPRIETSRLLVDTDRTDDLDGVLALMSEGDDRYRYSVAWVDCLARGRHLGRSVLTRGDFATRADLPSGQPLEYDARVIVEAPPLVPGGLVNPLTMRAFNEFWYRKAPGRRRDEVQTIPQFFHPLDAVGRWNRLYGRTGFLQWQFVVPFGAEDTLRHAIEELSNNGVTSMVPVLKRFGPASRGPLSFPFEGWTFTVDMPVTPGLDVRLDRMDEEIVAAGGRVYLAKDSRVRRSLIPAMYPRLDEWRAVRDRVDPHGLMVSDLDRRLNLSGRHG